MVWQSNSALHELCTNISLEKAVHNCKTLLGDIKRNAKRSVCPPFLFPYRKKMMFLSALPLLLVSIFTATGSKAGRYSNLGTYKRSVNTLFTLNILRLITYTKDIIAQGNVLKPEMTQYTE